MGISVGDILAKVTGRAVSSTVSSVGNVLDNLFTSDEERLEAERLAKEIEQRPLEAQWKTNLAEAQHRSVFVAGWRPAIGWVCALSLASYYIPQYVLGSVIWAMDCWSSHTLKPYPLEINGLMGLVTSLLGMGALRTIEKFGKVAAK